jgi:hypothetical protein
LVKLSFPKDCVEKDSERYNYTWDSQQPRLQSDQKERRIRLARLWQDRKAEKEGSHRLQSQDETEDQDSGQDRRQISSRQGRKGRDSGVKK